MHQVSFIASNSNAAQISTVLLVVIDWLEVGTIYYPILENQLLIYFPSVFRGRAFSKRKILERPVSTGASNVNENAFL